MDAGLASLLMYWQSTAKLTVQQLYYHAAIDTRTLAAHKLDCSAMTCAVLRLSSPVWRARPAALLRGSPGSIKSASFCLGVLYWPSKPVLGGVPAMDAAQHQHTRSTALDFDCATTEDTE